MFVILLIFQTITRVYSANVILAILTTNSMIKHYCNILQPEEKKVLCQERRKKIVYFNLSNVVQRKYFFIHVRSFFSSLWRFAHTSKQQPFLEIGNVTVCVCVCYGCMGVCWCVCWCVCLWVCYGCVCVLWVCDCVCV